MKTFKLKTFRTLIPILLTAALLSPLSSCRAQDENEDGMPVGNQNDGLANLDAKTPRVIMHAPTSEERSQKTSAQSAALAENKKALMPIIIAAKASDETKQTAGELADFLERITSAKFEIQTPDGKAASLDPTPRPKGLSGVATGEKMREDAQAKRDTPGETLPQSGIVLGTLDEFSAPTLEKPLAIRDNYNGREAYAIRTDAKRVLILSREERGIHHAAYRFLHEIGCRWFFAGSNWEVIPDIKNLSFNQDITDRPTIGSRVIAFMDGAFKDEGNVPLAQSRETRDKAAWTRRNGMGASLKTDTAHAWHRVVEANHDTLLQHPEYFAEVGGKRNVPMKTGKGGKPMIDALNTKLELGNPAVRQMFVDYALNFFRAHPDADMVPLDPTDGGGHSESPESQKLGTVSDAVFGMVNEVARAVAKEFPGKMVGVLAYNYHMAPPAFEMEPNVYVEITAGFNRSSFSYEQLYQMWPKLARNFGFYEYFSVFDWDHSALPGGRVSNVKWTKDRIAFYAGMNAVNLFAQSTNAWGANGRGYYLASKLMWNPQADVDAILEDFYEKAYGPAAPAMKRFHGRIGGDSGKFDSVNFIGAALRDLQDGSTLAKDRPDVLARISDYKQYMRYVYLRSELGNTPDKTEGRAKFIAMMQQLFAMRYSYMAHFAGATYRLGKLNAARFNDITLINASSRSHPKFAKIAGDRAAPEAWLGGSEPTSESIEADFQDALKHYPAVEVNSVKFDMSDLVPVEFPPTIPALMTNINPRGTDDTTRADYYQSAPRYIFYSIAGEPIEMTVAAGQIKKNNRDATWTLRKSDESVVAQGTVPLTQEAQKLSIPVPGAGMYYFDAQANSNGWVLEYSTQRPASVVWPENSTIAKGFAGAFFYVPKGTRQIDYLFNQMGGKPHVFLQPDGKVAATISGNNTVARIPVPEGMDGKVWRISPNTPLRGQWFYNLPNIAAASPDALLIPRSLTEKDGLKIRKNGE